MLIYYFVWFLVATLALPLNFGKFKILLFYALYLFLIIFTGLRFQVGGDWLNYEYKFNQYNYVTNLDDFLLLSEPAYGLLNFLSLKIGLQDTILVNFICALLFFLCLMNLSKKLNSYFFPVFLCTAYTIIVVATGYTRQSVAIGFSLLGFYALLEKKSLKFLLFIFIGSLFHSSIIVLFLFFPFAWKYNYFHKKIIFFSYLFSAIIASTGLLYYSTQNDLSSYTDGEMTSSGVYMRLIMHIIPMVFYIYYRPMFKRELKNYKLLDFLFLIIVYQFFLAAFFSTLVDRLNLFLVFFDIFILTYIYLHKSKNTQFLLWLSILISHSVVLTIWLLYGKWTAVFWIPYNNYILEFINQVF